MSSKQSSHNQYQRVYFDTVDRARLAIGETPYVLAHVNRVVAAAALKPGQCILEVGAGPGTPLPRCYVGPTSVGQAD